MKKFFVLYILWIVSASCVNSQKVSVQQVDQYGKAEPITDSILRSLQQKNDLLLITSTETYAWGHNATHLILALNKDEWTAYYYYVTYQGSLGKNEISSYNINPVVVSKESCDSILQFFEKNEVWKIKGDNGEDFCSNGTKSCTINDGATTRLWMITKNKIINPSYYEPVFMERCCPGNEERKLFIEATNKITHLVSVIGHSR